MTEAAAQRDTTATTARHPAPAQSGAVQSGAGQSSAAQSGAGQPSTVARPKPTPGPTSVARSESALPQGPAAGRQPTESAERRRWRAWRQERAEAVSAPYGPLSVTGTHWLADSPDGYLPDVPGRWTEDGEELVLRAVTQDQVAVAGQPLDGEARLGPEHGPLDARVTSGDRHLVVLRREGLWAVRVFDPDAVARRTFAGIDAFDYAEQWAVPAAYRAFDTGRTVQVANADGTARGLGLTGEVVFTVDGVQYALAAGTEGDGSLWIVLADGTSGRAKDAGGSYPFRFLHPGTPAPDGTLTLDFNRALLPPCAFAGHFLCPFPPPGNTLPFPLTAGERNLLTAG